MSISVDRISQADVVTDGSLGPAGALDGPEYQIGAELGRQTGGNLFHSFSRFNIETGESAVFSGPSSIQNIISRVTGGEVSSIDGMIRNTVQGADFYFLNPAGIVFGSNASLDITGSFHATTADYLRLGEDGRFGVPERNDLLTAATPAAFGFLDWETGPITINGKGRITQEEFLDEASSAYLVQPGESFSFVGGDIRIQSGTYAEVDGEILPRGTLVIMENGRMDIASVASPGEVVIGENGPDVSGFEQLGDISMAENAVLHAGGGTIMIRGGNFYMRDSGINVGQLRFSLMDISGKSGGRADIRTETLTMENSGIMAQTHDSGTGGHIGLSAGSAIRLKDSRIFADSYSDGDAGDIHISAPTVTLEASAISTSGRESGSPGGILLDVEDLSLTEGASISADCLAGDHYKGVIIGRNVNSEGRTESSLRVSLNDGAFISTSSQGSGRAGSIAISTEVLEMNGASITSAGLDAGDAGNILVGRDVMLSNRLLANVEAGDLIGLSNGSRITTSSAAGGDAGMILAFASQIGLTGGSFISSSATSAGQSGNAGIVYLASGRTDLNDNARITTSNAGQGNAGAVIMDTSVLNMDTGAGVSSASLSSETGGIGGIILIDAAGSIRLANQARITTSSFGTGKAGSIGLMTPELRMGNGAFVSSESLSRSAGGNAGNIFFGRRLAIKLGGDVIDWENRVAAMLTMEFDISEAEIESIDLPGQTVTLDTGAFVSTSTAGGGNAGSISLAAGDIGLDSGALIYSASLSETGGGDAGLIRISQTGSLAVSDGSAIATEAIMAGGGRIIAEIGGKFYLNSAEISTSVQFGTGNGGDIDIGNPEHSLLNNGLIVARAYQGNGGSIRIAADNFVQCSHSVISASSALGIDGSVVIESPETDAESGIAVLPSTFLDASEWMDTPCSLRENESTGRFAITGRDALPSVPYDVNPPRLLWLYENEK